MLTNKDLYQAFGHPKDEKNMILFDVPIELEIGLIPRKIYCNKVIIEPLKKAFQSLIERDFVKELKTWDGCFNVRPVRGYEKKYKDAMRQKDLSLAISLLSIHSWGCAIDLNAFENGLGATPKLSKGFVKCFTDAGFDWGGNFKRKDGMHFQLSKL